MNILVVEDHGDTRAVLGLLLNRCGGKTVTAKNAREALARLDDMKFDVLISDLTLPDVDGIVLVAEAKKKQQLCTIAITGRTTPGDREAALQAGFDFYLTKPVDYNELRKALGLEKRSSGRV